MDVAITEINQWNEPYIRIGTVVTGPAKLKSNSTINVSYKTASDSTSTSWEMKHHYMQSPCINIKHRAYIETEDISSPYAAEVIGNSWQTSNNCDIPQLSLTKSATPITKSIFSSTDIVNIKAPFLVKWPDEINNSKN